MVAKARRLLRAPAPNEPLGKRGLLLIHETLALDAKATGALGKRTNVLEWVAAIEQMGFVHLRHAMLKRSHALAFATKLVDATELEQLLQEGALPELLLRREVNQRNGQGSGLPYIHDVPPVASNCPPATAGRMEEIT
jgi:hypothetical protein